MYQQTTSAPWAFGQPSLVPDVPIWIWMHHSVHCACCMLYECGRICSRFFVNIAICNNMTHTTMCYVCVWQLWQLILHTMYDWPIYYGGWFLWLEAFSKVLYPHLFPPIIDLDQWLLTSQNVKIHPDKKPSFANQQKALWLHIGLVSQTRFHINLSMWILTLFIVCK